MSLIGMPLDEVKAMLDSDGVEYTVTMNSIDKNTASDSVLVTNAVEKDGVLHLVTSPFLIDVD